MSTVEEETRTVTTDPMIPTWYDIQRVRRDTHDTFTLDLGRADFEGSFRFSPGQFNMLYVYGVGEVPISISGDPSATGRIVHTARAVGKVTRAMWRLKRGDAMGVRGPFGTAWPVDEAVGKDVVIVAGGIGLAPLRSVMYHILAHRGDYRRVVLLYGARTPDDILYREQIAEWRSHLDVVAEVTVDRATGHWRGNVGVVTTLIPRAPFDCGNALAMVCGPEVMMRFTIMSLQKRGLDTRNVYVSMERNMKCALGFCGHCQYGPSFVCKDGPVFRFDRLAPLFSVREI